MIDLLKCKLYRPSVVFQYAFAWPDGPISARICQGCQINIICVMVFFCFQVDWPKTNFGLGKVGWGGVGWGGGGWLGVISRGAEKKAVYGITQRNWPTLGCISLSLVIARIFSMSLLFIGVLVCWAVYGFYFLYSNFRRASRFKRLSI